MKHLVLYKNRPIYASNCTLDWYLVLKTLINNLIKEGCSIEPLNQTDCYEYIGYFTIRGFKLDQWLACANVEYWTLGYSGSSPKDPTKNQILKIFTWFLNRYFIKLWHKDCIIINK